MSIFRKKIDEITIDNIESFIAEKHPENIRLEYKEGFSSTAPNEQIAKEVAALANQYGGVIIYGVREESGKTRRPDAIIGIDKSADPRAKIQSVCIDHIYPPITPEIQVCELKSNDTKAAVVVRVDMSDEAPHTINNRTGFYIRSQDRSDPREMTSDEIELLWNRRVKVIERREWLLSRSYKRVLGAVVAKRVSLKTPLLFRAIPLYPLVPLTERTKLFTIFGNSIVPGSQDFPLMTSDIKTSSDSIYAHLIGRNDKDPIYRLEDYGELNIFGQVTYVENGLYAWDEVRGIVLDWQMRSLLLMMKFLAKWYKNLGYWGIVKFIFEIENIRGVKCHLSSLVRNYVSEFKTAQIDNDIRIEREFSISDLIDDPEAIATDIFKEYLWDCGLNIHNADVAVGSWIPAIKKNIGTMKCINCKKADIYAVDEICEECKKV